MRNKLSALSFILAIFTVFSASPVAADVAAGKVIAENVCQTCHGMDGVATTPVAANLSGQQEMYMKIQLEHYRDGKRDDAQMSIIVQMLSDEDIANVAAYYSNIKVTVEMPQ